MASGSQGSRVVAPGGTVTNISGVILPSHIFEEILLQLPIDDVHRCMSVCKTWYDILHLNNFFWKSYIQRHYDLTPVDDILKSGLVGSTLGKWLSEEDGFYNYELTEPAYVFKPYPKLLKCDIIVGAGYNPMVGMVSDGKDKSETTEASESKKIDYHNLATAISILRHMLKRSQEFGCTSPAYGNEGDGTVMMWFAPQPEENQKLPGIKWVMSYFNANPELYNGTEGFNEEKHDELNATVLRGSFGMTNMIGLPSGEDDDDDDDDDEDDDDEGEKAGKKSFQKWLQGLYRPSYHFYCGENLMNSVLYFHYTTLAPGYVGGTMSDLVMT